MELIVKFLNDWPLEVMVWLPVPVKVTMEVPAVKVSLLVQLPPTDIVPLVKVMLFMPEASEA